MPAQEGRPDISGRQEGDVWVIHVPIQEVYTVQFAALILGHTGIYVRHLINDGKLESTVTDQGKIGVPHDAIASYREYSAQKTVEKAKAKELKEQEKAAKAEARKKAREKRIAEKQAKLEAAKQARAEAREKARAAAKAKAEAAEAEAPEMPED